MSEPATIAATPTLTPRTDKFSAAMQSSDRLPPNSADAEKGILGCIMLNAKDSMPACIERLKGQEVFYDIRHQRIYETMLRSYDENRPIDLITLHEDLKNAHILEECGGIHYISLLSDAVPSAANLGYYLDIVCEKFTLRRLLHVCANSMSGVYQCEAAHDLVEAHERQIVALMTGDARQQLTIKEAVTAVIQQIESFHQKKGANGLPTGLTDLDSLICGLQPQELIVLAGRPSTGKTSLAMQIAAYLAISHRVPAGVFSLEMSIQSLVLRLLCSRASVDSQRLRRGIVTEGDFPKLTNAAGKIAAAPLYIDDTSGLTLPQLRSKARRMHQLHGIKLLVVDYLQLVTGHGRKENRQQEVADICGGMKSLAKELDLPVILLSQLNRDSVKVGAGRKAKPRRPMISDLRDSGSIEQDADQVWLLSRPDEEDHYKVLLDVAKHRNGKPDDVLLSFIKQYTTFEDAPRQERDLDL